MKVTFQTSEEKRDIYINGDKALSLPYSVHEIKWFTWFKD